MNIHAKYPQIIILFLMTNCFSNLYGQTNIKYCSIYGVVVDSVTHEPIVGASVILLQTYLGASTDNNGRYFIKNVPPGKYDLMISCIGYLKKNIENLVLKSGESLRLDETLRDYNYRYADIAKEELSKGIVNFWIGGLVIIAKNSSSIPDSVRQEVINKYGGFKDVLIGCDPTGAKEHNAIIEEYLEKRNGKDWRKRMEEELKKLEEYYKSKK